MHGDDFAVLIRRSQVDEFVTAMKKRLLVKVRAVLGPKPNDDHEIRLLNRIVTWKQVTPGKAHSDEIWWEADPRHVEILAKDFGFNERTKSVAAPGNNKIGACPGGTPGEWG